MRRKNGSGRFQGRSAWIVGLSGLLLAGLPVALDRVAPEALGQDPSTLGRELQEVVSAALPGERVPVLVELVARDAPRPAGARRDLRAAQHASDLAGIYENELRKLGDEVDPALALDLIDSDVIWIGGAIATALSPSRIRALGARAEVNHIYYDGLVQVELQGALRPRSPLALQDPGGGLPWGLLAINAPTVWEAGATGQGSVVAILDSGVDIDHPLLRRRWRGMSTSAQEAWFDPWNLTDVPEDDNSVGGVGHGTIVTTVAVGALEPGDTLLEAGGTQRVVQDELEVVTGVAPGAEWVAANAFQEFGGLSYTRRSVLLQALQWALDPDGDPSTVSDVPDVVNNSWGFLPGTCGGVFDRAIDALELAGVPVVFSAGNRSAGFDTVAAPGNRADLLLNAFAVGALERREGEIRVAPNSLGGPSPCAPGAVKPEVAAPGDVPLVRDRGPNKAEVRGPTGAFTSWAAPHAAGALAVLASLNSSAGSHELKQALFSTARDLPPPGLDNRSGAGMIDLAEASARIGGVGGLRLELVAWSREPGSDALSLELLNLGAGTFAGGGTAELLAPGDSAAARVAAPPIAPGARVTIRFPDLPRELEQSRLRLRLRNQQGSLELPIRLRAAPVTTTRLQDGSVGLSVDASGRIGRVTGGGPGFAFADGDWLTAGAFLFAADGRVSDAAYVDVRGEKRLKSNPVGSDTDWSGTVAEAESDRALLNFSDARALEPLGASVEGSVRLVEISDSAAFATFAVNLDFPGVRLTPLSGLLLDWDFSRDSVYWDEELGASVMTAADSAGPWMAVTSTPRRPVTHAALPLGTANVGGFYEVGSGLLAPSSSITQREAEKGRILRLGGDGTSRPSTTDWGQMIGVGPARPGETQVFIIAAARSRTALPAAIDSAISFAHATETVQPATGPVSDLQILPPFPNPFDPAQGETVNLPFLMRRGSDPVSASVEVFTITGRLVFSQSVDLGPADPLQPFRWDGRLANGELAATGVYGYVIQIGGQRQSGKLVLLK